MANRKSTFKILLGIGLAAGAAATVMAMTPRGKKVRRTVEKKVRAGSHTIKKFRDPMRKRNRVYA